MTAKSDDDRGNTRTGHEYDNFDLKAAAEAARKSTIRFAFEFPNLLTAFEKADAEANRGRDRNRRRGVIGVGLVLVSLLYAATAPMLQDFDEEAPAWLGSAATVLGLFGAAIGLTGSLKNSKRDRWLSARSKAETLRLFHFHYMAARLADIEAAGNDLQLQAKYVNAREDALDHLLSQPLERKKTERELSFHPFAFIEEQQAKWPVSPVAADFFAAWRVLRLDWQLKYCNAKLDHRVTKKKLSPRQLEQMFSTFGWFCFGAIVVLHLAHLGERYFPFKPWLEISVLWIALIALTARVLEDGLRPQREVERYEQYRAKIIVAGQRFDNTHDMAAKLEIVRSFEQTSYEEMATFIRTHADAKFLV